MCSSTSARLARIYRAIEELESLGAGDREAGASGSAGAGGGAEAGRGEGHNVAGSPTALSRAVGAVDESAAGAEGDGVADGDGEAGADGGSEADAKGDRTGDEGEGGAYADVTNRLAEIWAMIADADPELAKRLPRYLGSG